MIYHQSLMILNATSMTIDTQGNTTTGGPAALAFAANYTGLNSGAGLLDF